MATVTTTLILATSVASSVVQNGISNSTAKRSLKKGGDIYRFSAIMYALTFVILLGIAVFEAVTAKSLPSLYSVLLGVIFGITTTVSYQYRVKALSEGPLHLTTLVTTSSMLIPTLSGVVLFDEGFNYRKMIAVFVLIFFIWLSVSGKKENADKNAFRPTLKWALHCLVAFVTQGAIGVIQKIHQHSEYKAEVAGFLAASFLFSFLFSLVSSRVLPREARFTKKLNIFALIGGVCVFIMNYINLILSGLLPSQLFFPLVNGTVIVLTSLTSIILFKEHITKKQAVGLVGGIISLIMICLL